MKESSPPETLVLGRRKYRAFISYSQAADGRLAPALQKGLQHFAKPWYRRRALRVFRDQTGLSVSPELWGSIEAALRESDFFILLASPASAASPWVAQEIQWWLTHRSTRQMFLVLTEGELHWDDAGGDFDWNRSNALNPRLRGVFPVEPLYLDLRWAETDSALSLRRPQFAEAIARLAAPLHGRTLDELIGEDIRQHAATLRLVKGSVVGLIALTALAFTTAVFAWQARKATDQLTEASRQESARILRAENAQRLATLALNQVADPQLRILLAAEAVRLQTNDTTVAALRRTLAGPLAFVQSHSLTNSDQDYAVFRPSSSEWLHWGGTQAWVRGSQGEVRLRLNLSPQPLFHAAFSDDGRQIVTVQHETPTRLWNADQGQLIREFDSQPSIALLNRDGSRLLTVEISSMAILWDTTTGQRIAEFEIPPYVQFTDQTPVAAFSPSGEQLALCTRSGPVLLESRTGLPIRSFHAEESVARSIDFSPDGFWLVTTEGQTLRRWRVADGQLTATWKAESELYDAKISPDGRWVAAWGADRIIRVWNAETGQRTVERRVRTFDGPPLVFRFGPAGRVLLVAAYDAGPAELLDPGSGDLLASLPDPESERRTQHFSPDGRWIAVGNLGGPMRLFPGTLAGGAEDLLTLARQRVTRELTTEERADYLVPRRP